MFDSKSFNLFVVFLFMAVGLASCSGPSVFDQNTPEIDSPETVTTGTSQTTYPVGSPAYLLEVEEPNSDKIYVFTDISRYRDYLSNGELPSGKEVNDFGQTRVLVDVPEDSSLESIGVYQLYQGELEPGEDFYVQRLVKHPTQKSRFYVFSSPDLLNTPMTELPMQQSAVDGPNSELVIYSLKGTDFYSLQQQFLDINDN
ncbi:MAG: hypothetical protein DRR19_32335 [Candidatus Parabeggiatoa sp. nov. 1]|nr:MAG: hypothetical protein DRR19_32335 [Gammaproteobacteria bacterium]